MIITSSSTSVAANSTIILLDKCTTLSQVRQIHSYMIKTNLVTTHSLSVAKLISGFSESSNPSQAVMLYAHMLFCVHDLKGIEFSVPSVIKACGRSRAFREAHQILAHVLKTRLWYDPFVTNSVVRMWLELGEIELARKVFDRMPVRDLISWNSLITGYLRDVFMTMKVKDVVTWTTMISACVLNHRPRKGLDLFREMLRIGIRPDAPSIVSVLSAIADLGFVEEGKWIHTYISANKIDRSGSSFIGSALVNMYAKCGQIEHAYHVFRSISHLKNIGDWNSMISGFAIHGLGHEAIKLFLEMEMAELKPDDITFLGLLSACNHGGLTNEGQFYFQTMQVKYNMVPKIQHYGCIIDLLGRAGHLQEALRITYHMPLEPDVLIWKAILSASMKHNKVETARIAALRAIELDPEDSSCYVLLSNMYAKVGMWDEVGKVRTMMKKRGVRKIPGCSSIFVNGKVHEFLIGKAMDLGDNENVHCMIEEMVSKLKLEGYEPDLNQVLLDIEEDDEKESQLALHSEKMALAFGLMNIPHGIPIHIVKNLRICCDCHSFMQMVSKIYKRRIVVRDQNRFHHFENGSCSCNDHW
ncbi:pentatricopeptide repeat-containing protein [Senna tora]|uniref:Pentatricopeptide repeat-containing protein n=1 Tax=Senna tora TaxID=362788 RepID=A0A834TJA2_9FABA|nr:pentatricopeptide repeat-containing protein [Senna tora]